MNDELFLEIWSLFLPFVPEKEREVIARQFIETFENCGQDIDQFEEIHGADRYIDEVLAELGYANEMDDSEEEI